MDYKIEDQWRLLDAALVPKKKKEQRLDDTFIVDCIRQTGGIKTVLARRLGLTMSGLDNVFKVNPLLLEVFNDEKEKMVDEAEAALYDHIRQGKLDAVKFVLTTKGKGRGYVERQEVQHTGAQPIQLVFDDNHKTHENTKTEGCLELPERPNND